MIIYLCKDAGELFVWVLLDKKVAGHQASVAPDGEEAALRESLPAVQDGTGDDEDTRFHETETVPPLPRQRYDNN